MVDYELLRTDIILGMKFHFYGFMVPDGIMSSITIMYQNKTSMKTIGKIYTAMITDSVELDKAIKKILRDFLHQKENQEKIAKYLLTNSNRCDII